MTQPQTYSSNSIMWPFREQARLPFDACFRAPQNRQTVESIAAFALAEATLGSGISLHPSFNNTAIQGGAKRLLADLLRVAPEDISLKENTNAALLHIAHGFPFAIGDEIITYAFDYPSVHLPFKPLKNIKIIPLQGNIDANEIPLGWSLEELEQKITSRTKMVVVSHVHFISGDVVDLKALSTLCRSRNIFLVIDTAQSAGVLPVYPTEIDIDAIVFPCWKGLLASRGIACLWTSPRFREHLQMTLNGSGALEMRNFTDWDATPCSDGRKFEPSTLPTNLIAGLCTSLETNFMENGIENIHRDVSLLQKLLLNQIDPRLAVPLLKEESTSGLILSFRLTDHIGHEEDIISLAASHGLIITQRAGAIRFAPHYYLNEDDIERAAWIFNSIASNKIGIGQAQAISYAHG